MNRSMSDDQLSEECLRRFATLVESVGVKRFASELGLSTRQVNRILASAQPNPVERIVRSLQSATTEAGDRVVDFICQEMGGHFVRHEALDTAAVNAVKECAEAIAAISDGQVSDLDVREIREAISALSGLIVTLKDNQHEPRAAPGPPGPRTPRGPHGSTDTDRHGHDHSGDGTPDGADDHGDDDDDPDA